MNGAERGYWIFSFIASLLKKDRQYPNSIALSYQAMQKPGYFAVIFRKVVAAWLNDPVTFEIV